jgi:hypothetical protein
VAVAAGDRAWRGNRRRHRHWFHDEHDPISTAGARASLIGGIAVYLAPLASKAFAALFDAGLLTTPDWNARDDSLKYRIDAVLKMTGGKVFARDIRARDMPVGRNSRSMRVLRVTRSARRIYRLLCTGARVQAITHRNGAYFQVLLTGVPPTDTKHRDDWLSNPVMAGLVPSISTRTALRKMQSQSANIRWR